MKQKESPVDDFLGDSTGLRAMALIAAELSELDHGDHGPVSFELTARINYRGQMVVETSVDSKNYLFGTGKGGTLLESLLDLAKRMNEESTPAHVSQVIGEVIVRLSDGRMKPA